MKRFNLKAGWFKTSLMAVNVRNITLGVLREPQNETDPLPLNQAKQIFDMCMDLEEIERAGLNPLKQSINDIGGWQLLDPENWKADSFDWIKAVAETTRKTKQHPVISGAEFVNLADTEKQSILLDQTDFSLLPRSVLIARDSNLKLFEAYETFIVRVATELDSAQNDTQLKEVAKNIIAFEEKLAHLTRSEVDRYNLRSIFNQYILKDFQLETDGLHETLRISWTKFLTDLGIENVSPEEEVVVAEPEYVKGLIPLLAEEETKGSHVLANYILWRFVAATISRTTENMRNILFDFQKELSGAPELPPREAICSAVATNMFGLPVSAKYVEKAFESKYRDEINAMVEDLKEAFMELVNEATWMKNETKEKALEKSGFMKTLMAYPDWISNKTELEQRYHGLELGSDYLTSAMAISEYSVNKAMKSVREPSNREPWDYAPLTDINGFHFFYYNTIVILVGILQVPYFGGVRPKHQNYAGIGMVIGHEITHGFDQQGSQFDKIGNLANWWDEDTKREYDLRGKCMAEQYSKYCFDFEKEGDRLCLNGELGLGENIGDNGGLRESYRAYRKYVQRNGEELRLPGLESMTPDQLFFIGYANGWCGSMTPEALRRQILIGPHSPGEYRLKGPIRNSFDFAEAYQCPEDSNGMNPPASEKCTVW